MLLLLILVLALTYFKSFEVILRSIGKFVEAL